MYPIFLIFTVKVITRGRKVFSNSKRKTSEMFMIPEAIDLLCIPVLMKEVALRPLNDDEAKDIALSAIRILPTPKEMELVIIPSLYYVSDLFNRSLFDELSINSVALAELMKGKGSDGFHILNPFKLDGLLPIPRSIGDGDGSLTWAVLPVVAFGDGYIDLDEYLLERDISEELGDLKKKLSQIYGAEFVQVFPPVLVEDLLDEIKLMEEELSQNVGISLG